MLDFAIIGLPRSGTTWAANWLTTDTSICLHDPLVNQTLDQLAAWDEPKLRGVSCTGLWMFPDWVKANVRNWIVIDRPVNQVNKSLTDIGLGSMPADAVRAFQEFPGLRATMDMLFDKATAPAIWEHLLPQVQFDKGRHKLLSGFMVNPYFKGWEPEPEAVQDWMARICKAAQA